MGTWISIDIGDWWADGYYETYLVPVPGPTAGGSDPHLPGDVAGDYVMWELRDGNRILATSFENECLSAAPGEVGAEPLPPPSAEEIWSRVELPTPTVRLNPRGDGLVGSKTWFWYDEATEVSLPGLDIRGWSVDASAVVVDMRWYFDDTTLVAEWIPGTEDDPAATHIFQDRGEREVVMELTWEGTATIAGPGVPAETVDIGTGSTSNTRSYVVREIQPRIVDVEVLPG